jgi:peptidoglycan/LPS O-acetylase OafA/YrhL
VIVLASIALYPLSTLSGLQYFGVEFWKYLGANLLFLNFLAPSLPGVFTSNSTPIVNGALWTLKIEVAFYLFVPVMHYLCSRVGTKKIIAAIFCLSCAWKYSFALLAQIDYSHHLNAPESYRSIYSQMEVQFPAQLVYFTAGILLFLYFDKLNRHFIVISGVSVCLFLLDQWITQDLLDVFWISGFVFVFGFWRYLGNFSRRGDFSYGVYIVHWPILQVLVTLGLARLPPPIFLAVALVLIGTAAFLMWTSVESRFLAGSSHYRQVSRGTG